MKKFNYFNWGEEDILLLSYFPNVLGFFCTVDRKKKIC